MGKGISLEELDMQNKSEKVKLNSLSITSQVSQKILQNQSYSNFQGISLARKKRIIIHSDFLQ